MQGGSEGDDCRSRKNGTAILEFPILVNGLDGPVELLPERFREESFDRNVELLRENNSETGIDVILLNVRKA